MGTAVEVKGGESFGEGHRLKVELFIVPCNILGFKADSIAHAVGKVLRIKGSKVAARSQDGLHV